MTQDEFLKALGDKVEALAPGHAYPGTQGPLYVWLNGARRAQFNRENEHSIVLHLWERHDDGSGGYKPGCPTYLGQNSTDIDAAARAIADWILGK